MKAKYIISGLFLFCLAFQMQAQTMRWIPTPQKSTFGKCIDQSSKSGLTQCYVLEYTPKVSGVLTSYTTGFLVSCTSLGSPIELNQCCGMTDKNNIVNGCSSMGKVLLNSSGNSGTLQNNQVIAGEPVILHQVCMIIPMGEKVTMEEEHVTDLTTSIDVGNGQYVTEYPTFETATFHRVRYDDANQTLFLDFQGERAGDRLTKLDWTITEKETPTRYIIERSQDGEVFTTVGHLDGKTENAGLQSYQFFDTDAQYGLNFYRILQQNAEGKDHYSEVQKITFYAEPFIVEATPNPAKEKITISLKHTPESGEAHLIDASGKIRATLNFNRRASSVVFELDEFEAGIYTVQVKSGEELVVKKLSVIK